MKAYVTLLSNRRYLLGVIGLFRSLQSVGSKYPLYCMLSANAEQGLDDELISRGINVIRLSGNLNDVSANESCESYTHWSFTFDKLKMWGLTQFEKIVFLDSDMLVRANIDSLFDAPEWSAAVAGASMFGWTKLNSGLMVVRPDKETETQLIEMAPLVIDEFQRKRISVGDQDIIQHYFKDWENHRELLLPEGYNMVADWINVYCTRYGFCWNGKRGKPIKVVHFIGHTKPWTSKTMREKIWVIKTSIRNPYYLLAFLKFKKFIRKDKRSLKL